VDNTLQETTWNLATSQFLTIVIWFSIEQNFNQRKTKPLVSRQAAMIRLPTGSMLASHSKVITLLVDGIAAYLLYVVYAL
jgi:hypothetical protein